MRHFLVIFSLSFILSPSMTQVFPQECAQLIGHYKQTDANEIILNVIIEGNYAYVAEWARLSVLDISIPSAPVKIGEATGGGPGLGLAKYGEYIVVVSIGLVGVYDVSNPYTPLLVYMSDQPLFPGWGNGIVTDQSFAYMAIQGGGLYILNLDNPENPFVTGFWEEHWMHVMDIVISGSYSYLATTRESCCLSYNCYKTPLTPPTNYFYGGLLILDVSDPALPTETGYFEMLFEWGGESYARSIELDESLAYVTFDNYGIMVFDISDPVAPVEMSRFLHEADNILDIVLGDHAAYVSEGCDGILVLDIRNPLSMKKIDSFKPEGCARKLFLSGSHLYVATYSQGIQIYDVSNCPPRSHDRPVERPGTDSDRDVQEELRAATIGTEVER